MRLNKIIGLSIVLFVGVFLGVSQSVMAVTRGPGSACLPGGDMCINTGTGSADISCPPSGYCPTSSSANPGGQQPPAGLSALGIQIINPLGSDSGTVGDIVDNILDFLLQIGVPIAALMYVWAGFLFLTSSGNETKVKKAKQAIIWTTVGLAVLVIGKGFVSVVQNLLVV